jgi:cytochrome P450
MSDGNIDLSKDARARAYALPLDQLNPGDPALFRTDSHWPILERLRKEDPVHYTAESEYGPYWSITKYNDIMAVDTNHQVFSSEGGITIASQEGEEGPLPMFIAMDPPKHDVQRKTVSPAVSPARLHVLEPLIRERAAKILDGLPIGEEFDWVDKVSMELTAMTLATLFDMPQEADLLVRRGHRRAGQEPPGRYDRTEDGDLRGVSRLLHRAVEPARQRPARR